MPAWRFKSAVCALLVQLNAEKAKHCLAKPIIIHQECVIGVLWPFDDRAFRSKKSERIASGQRISSRSLPVGLGHRPARIALIRSRKRPSTSRSIWVGVPPVNSAKSWIMCI
jgi:hypothetical protein